MEQQGYFNNNICNNRFNTENLNNATRYNAALYMRFSKDDGQTCDSSSITTQKMMLEKYCQDNGFKIYDSYVDDGYTGLNFDRPDFQRLLNDIDGANVNLVITKDLSRLGRDYIQTGYYSEVYFPEHGIRYIAVNDGFDSLKADNDIAPFKNILNNMYSRDLSRKIKSAIRQRVTHGLYCAGFTPYGYKKDPNNKNRLVVDEKAAENVREIFRLALEGKGCMVIARSLAARQILSPAAYKAEHGNLKFMNAHKSRTGFEADNFKWHIVTVRKILIDRVYVGDMVGCKSEIAFRTKKQTVLPKDKHIIVENTHEPLIDREDFRRAQDLMKARHRPSKYCDENLFKGILFCSVCGKRMILNINMIKTVHNGRIKRVFYRCCNHTINPDECPRNNFIYYDVLKSRVWESVKRVLELMGRNGKALETARKRIDGQNNSERPAAEKAKIEKRLNALTVIVRKVYEDYAAERLDESGYQGLLAGYQAEKKTLTERLAAIAAELGKADNGAESLQKLKLLADGYANSAELTAEIVHKLIERIELSPRKTVNNLETQEINIVYRFINTTL
jgi:DNA invertase Pin-like site-specific DNA recombinase